MASVKENLIAAKALIASPEKYADAPSICALEHQVGGDLLTALGECDPPFDGWSGPHWRVSNDDHTDIMALFDRAIAAQDEVAA